MTPIMVAQRVVKVFRNGRNQAVRIPREFELPGDEAIMRREGERLVIEPASPGGPNARLLAVLASLEPLAPEDDFGEIDDPPPESVSL